jgi:hypothetical protein
MPDLRALDLQLKRLRPWSSSGRDAPRLEDVLRAPDRSGTLNDRRFVFVGGLHRSGTTLVARAMAHHSMLAGQSGTGVVEDEGQHLQWVYPVDERFGGPGEFAFHPEMHLTEESDLAPDEARRQLLRHWAPHWDSQSPILVEKSPPNLIKMRFLQALFPGASFVMVMRHPVAAALATKKWVGSYSRIRHPLRVKRLIEHWLQAWELFLDDSALMADGTVLLVRYEDLVRDPQSEMARLWRFLAVADEGVDPGIRPGLNAEYMREWQALSGNRFGAAYRGRMTAAFESRARAFGYSLATPEAPVEPVPEVAELLSCARGEGRRRFGREPGKSAQIRP